MKRDNFSLIIEKYYQKKISDDEVRILLQSLKDNKATFAQQTNESTPADESVGSSKTTEIAVIGMSGQFPDADNPDVFWQNMLQGHDAVRELPLRYSERSRSSGKQSGRACCMRGGILKDRDCFDPLFFNISPREAESMNPHQRLVLEESWKALEDAGYNPKGLAGDRVGTFIGAEPSGYFHESFTGYSDAIIASRLSYYLDLKGPALVVNTGCSSSGVAIHLACESLRNGESSLALAGGVCTINQSGLVMLSEIGMLSPTGVCRTFDETADGTILSEGVGVVVLKRLEDAISNGDYIYGVIVGSGVNQDGASNGITAPNGLSQEQLITGVYERYGVNPENITYVEAHGTGTKLGDPVEANALVRAFKQSTSKEHYCVVGSAKSYIGHTGAAAGVIGLIKILLSLRHHQIPGLINFNNLNPLIEFKGSAFYISTKALPWRSTDHRPLMAALNSFGHSGTNVHLVVREYISPDEMSAPAPIPTDEDNPVLIPLSARDQNRLKEYAGKLMRYLKQSPVPELTAIAYTMQTGREAMEERAAFQVQDIPELITGLEAFIEDKDSIDNCWRGRVKQGRNMVHFFASDEDMQETVEKWFIKGKLKNIAELWVQGFAIDWALFYRDLRLRRISLPVYPFARERYWIPETGGGPSITTAAAYIHPLLHQNTSDFTEERFSSTFTGRESFLTDHVVEGRRVLPEVACLEMARAAVVQATGALEEGPVGIRLKDVVWARPVVVGEQPVQVNIGLFPGDNGEIDYEIYSESEADNAEPLVHSQGGAVLCSAGEVSTLDLPALQEQCNKRVLSSGQCYEIFRAMGIEHGSGYQGIEQMYVGSGQVLAKLSLPSSVYGIQNQFVLHPSLMDSAIQVSIGLMMFFHDSVSSTGKASLKPVLPLAMRELEVLGGCTSVMWAFVRYSNGSQTRDKTQKLDIDLCDETGNVCVRIKEFSLIFPEVEKQAEDIISVYPENIPSNIQNIKAQAQKQGLRYPLELGGNLQLQENDELLCRLLWGQLQSIGLFTKEKSVIADLKRETGLRDLYGRWLEESIVVLVQNNYLQYDGDFLIVIDTAPIDIDVVWKKWEKKKGPWLEEPDMKAKIILVESTLRALPEILTGKVPATDIMFPNSSMKLVEGIYKNNLISDYFNEALAGTLVAYIQERLKQDSSNRIRILEIGAGTGGTSAMVFLKLKPYQDNIQEYCYTDISKAFLLHAEREYGPQNPYLTYKIFNVEKPAAGQGISAGGYDIVIAANVLHATKNIRQTLRNTKAVLKKNGLILLNEMSGNTLFSHLTFGLLEGWWLYEDTSLRIPGCPGLYPKTWQAVLESEGFQSVFFPAQETHNLGQQIVVAESDGIVWQEQQIKPGVRHVKQSIRTSRPHISCKTPQLTTAQGKQLALLKTKPIHSTYDVTGQMIEDHIKETIIEKLSESLKMDIDMIDDDKSFADYGLDSILGVNLVQVINQILMIELETTSLFDYSSVNQLTAYILSNYKDVVAATLGQNAKQTGISDDLPSDKKEKHTVYSYPNRFHRGRILPELNIEKKEKSAVGSIQKDPIAIIGMSGRFAKSKTVNDLWKHLSNGTDLVEEVTRWDITKYYSEDMNYCKHGSFLDDIDQFDPLFFNISGLEATYMDPQQRLFLEESWKALEDAGYAGTRSSERLCGIYVGCCGGDYQQLFSDNPPAQAFWGNMGSVVPARIAYFLDLQGPAIAVDTACSSSLVAIHLACQGLWAGETEMALAGGVFIQSTPWLYLAANRAGMLSPTGRCHTFDERADGFVPGEGVGVVVLKRLKEAVADSDHIYGVIGGSGINQDGTTNGITAPSANSQERLVRHVYDTFNINPEQIQMVEAHGTGTKLGDPIEYQALTRTFRNYTDKKEYCAIGTIKTNIGHTQMVAGIAGIIKILLSLQHKQIPPSLHFQLGNLNIQLKDSPFYVNTSLKDWATEPDSKRCAVISSFGASGTNAHIVIEEAPKTEGQHSEKPGYLMVLSARTFEQLQQQAGQLVEFCEQEPHVDLGNMSYTLLLGRKHFNHRLECVVRSQNELVKYLKKWLEDGKVSQIYVSEAQKDNRKEKSALKQYGNQCIQSCQETSNAGDYLEHLSAIAELYVQGYALEFEKLFLDGQYRRISLPTYPFARERYWVTELQSKTAAVSTAAAAIHPLLHQNTSDLSEQRFTSIFTGNEFFLSDHVVNGQRLLPGVAYLEMARAAVEKAIGTLEDGQTGILLKNVVWNSSLIVGEQPTVIHIGIYPEDAQEISYEIYGETEPNEQRIVYNKGSAGINEVTEVPSFDLPVLQAQLDQKFFSSEQFYEAFKLMGLNYNHTYQGIEKLYIGPDQVLAKLSMHPSVSGTVEQFILHPILMDLTLKASISLVMDTIPSLEKAALELDLPSTLQELQILGKCSTTMWALIRYSPDNKIENKTQKLDIDLCDETGTVCVIMRGFSLRVLEGEAVSADIGTLMLKPYWKEHAVDRETAVSEYIRHLVMLCEPAGLSWEKISAQMDGVKCITLQSDQKRIDERFQTYTGQVFEKIQSLLQEKLKGIVLVQIVVPVKGEQQMFSGLFGVLKTAQLENPKLIGQLIEVEPGDDAKGIIEKIKENSRSPLDNHIKYQEGKRYTASLSKVEVSQDAAQIPWSDQGVYLITGGAGGLGLIFAREISQKVKDVTIILTGRSSLNKDKQSKLKELEALGARIEYKQVDVTQKKAVADLIQSINNEYGSLNGIIHAAGVIRDNFILNKTTEELKEVLTPKVDGLVNLDEASKDLPLDFFILFSSGAGVMGNLGQADYAAANAFMDAFAGYRNTLVASNQRHGQTLSINWPLWEEGGMRVGKETEKIWHSIGMIAMRTSTGIRALYQGMASGQDQVMFIEGDLKRLHVAIIEQQSGSEDSITSSSIEESRVVPVIAQNLLNEKAINYFKKLFSSVIKLPANRIEADVLFEKYGIDSIIIMKLTSELEKIFGPLSKTLFYEYQSIKKLTGYLLESYRDQLIRLLDLEEKSQKNVPNAKYSVEITEPIKSTDNHIRHRFGSVPKESSKVAREVSDIAIIGVSGRYPGAKNIQEFWKNLQDGKDCITEIPKDRWDHSLYFDEDKNKPGKTYSKWGGFIEGVEQFEPLFFNISPREAEILDPRERIFLETVWNLLECAGYTRDSLQYLYKGQIGVYVGATYQQYQSFTSDISKESIISLSSISSIANRVSHYFNLLGPSIAVDTACSSSAIAIHLAYQSLTKEECQMAIAGGVNLSIHPKKYLGLSMAQIIGSHINCRSFGHGDGYLPAEGVGAVLLKPLSKAIQDRDSILAVIKSTSTNHGGHTNGFTVPNPNAQAKLIEDNFNKAGIDPRTISYVEAAANGSSLGDPIEITGLNKAFQKFTSDQQFCAIGSVKSNIGHPEAASGIAQLTKVILQLQHRQLVPTIKAEPLNPYINFENNPFYLQRELQEWNQPVVKIDGHEREFPRRATVSSFGAGGTNAHFILEEYFPQKETIRIRTTTFPQIFVFSAKNQERLLVVAEQMLKYIKHEEKLSLADLAYTLQVGREAMECRLAIVVNTKEELIQSLKGYVQSIRKIRDLEISTFIVSGNIEEDRSNIRNLFSGKIEDNILQILLAEKDYKKLALYWTKGGEIPWESLHRGKEVRRISLPTYPFGKEHYWISNSQCETDLTGYLENEGQNSSISSRNPTKIVQEYFVDFLSKILNIAKHKIKLTKSLYEHGADSIVVMKLMRNFEQRFQIKIMEREILEYPTIQSLAAYLAKKIKDVNEHQTAENIEEIKTQRISKQKNTPKIEIAEELEPISLSENDIRNLLKIGDAPDDQINYNNIPKSTQNINQQIIPFLDEALEKFKQGTLTLEEMEIILQKGEIA